MKKIYFGRSKKILKKRMSPGSRYKKIPSSKFGMFQQQKWGFGIENFRLPLRFRKAGRLWCGGARGTHWATCHNWVIVTKTKQSLWSPCFSRSLWYFKNLKKAHFSGINDYREWQSGVFSELKFYYRVFREIYNYYNNFYLFQMKFSMSSTKKIRNISIPQ